MENSKTKTFTYWRVRFDPEPNSKTMQSLLSATFDKTHVKERQYKTSDDAPSFQFINQKSGMKGFFCANLFGYEEGRIEQIIKANFDKEYVETTALQAGKGDDGTDQHFLDGKLYFVCFDNHMILCQDQRIKAEHLERYLHDRIVAINDSVDRNFRFSLEPSIPLPVRKKISGVKRIELTSSLPGDNGTDGNGRGTTKIENISGLTKVAAALKNLFGSDVNLNDFSTKGIIEDNQLQVTLSLKWINRIRNESVADQLDTFSNVFRHTGDELDVKIETDNGTFKNEDLRLNVKKSVRHRDDMPAFDDIIDKMIGWYDDLNARKQI